MDYPPAEDMSRPDEHSETESKPTDEAASATDHAVLPKHLPRWSKGLLVLSIVLMFVGLTLRGYAYFSPGDELPQAGERAPLADIAPGFQPTDRDGGASTDPTAEASERGDDEKALDVWSPVVFRLGFSFFAGFTIAYAVRAFLKISFLFLGLAILGLFGLQYAGVIDVNWDAIGEHFASSTSWLGEQTANFRDFITGYLPSSASAGVGMIAGFRKK